MSNENARAKNFTRQKNLCPTRRNERTCGRCFVLGSPRWRLLECTVLRPSLNTARLLRCVLPELPSSCRKLRGLLRGRDAVTKRNGIHRRISVKSLTIRLALTRRVRYYNEIFPLQGQWSKDVFRRNPAQVQRQTNAHRNEGVIWLSAFAKLSKYYVRSKLKLRLIPVA